MSDGSFRILPGVVGPRGARSTQRAFAIGLLMALACLQGGTVTADEEPRRVGIIGLDTSHAPAFTKILNDEGATGDLAGFRVVAAYPEGSPDIESSVSRVPAYTAQLRELGVEIVDSIPALLERVDCVLLETNDGRPHLEQLLPVLRAGKPVFIDKPIAGSLTDTLAIFRLAELWEVPLFSSSSLRFAPSTLAVREGSLGRVLAADCYSPAALERTHPDLFWYGIHGVESLFTTMGPGCVAVRRYTAANGDVVVGRWSDGRVGIFRGLRGGKATYGGTAFGESGIGPTGRYEGYAPLVEAIARFFRSGEKPVSDRETIEIYAFMEAADESKRRGGEEVSIEEVIERARIPLSRGAPIVDASFPGGNAVIESVSAEEVVLRPDLRDSERWWFHWSIRVRGAEGRERIRVRFSGDSPIGVRGPAISRDGGRSWSWLGADSVDGAGFVVSFGPEEVDVRLAFAMPYLESDLRRFLAGHADSDSLRVETLATTREAREVELLRVGRLDGAAAHRVLLMARHHACESMASFALEGAIAAFLAEDELGEWLRAHVELLAVPFVDKDGVEDGDQGKLRSPRDHNRDYLGASVWRATAALRELAPAWADGRLRVALDLHCPWIRGGVGQPGGNEEVYLVGGPDAAREARRVAFAARLEAATGGDDGAGPIRYRSRHDLPWGEAWNDESNGLRASAAHWAATIPDVEVSTTIELPYANAGGVAVTPESARAFGRDLARAIRRYLEETER